MSYLEREETIRRLRELHGVLELSTLLAADALVEAHPGTLSSSQWFERLIHLAAARLTDAGRFHGRFVLFEDEELKEIYSALAENDSRPLASQLAGEIEQEGARRGWLNWATDDLVPEPESAEA